jgi:hypothetical protein
MPNDIPGSPGLTDVTGSDSGNPNSITVDVTSSTSTGNKFVDARPACVVPMYAPSRGPDLALGSISGFVREDVDNNDSGGYPLSLVNMTLLDSS